MNKSNLTTTLLIAVVVGVLNFYSGTLYQKNKTPDFKSAQFTPGMGRNINPSGRIDSLQVGRPVSGEITNIEDNTITIKTPDGSNKIVIYSGSTTINKTEQGSVEDLSVGSQIMVIGKDDDSGSLTAESISLGGNFISRLQPPTKTN